MTTSVLILADSISPEGSRLTTFAVTMPRFLLAQINKHASIRSTTQSSRAIPFRKMAERLDASHYRPALWKSNQKGMVAGEALTEAGQTDATRVWEQAYGLALKGAGILDALGVHKQWANRITEPFAYVEHILTATEWDNFWNLRCKPDAQDEMAELAFLMRDAYTHSTPTAIGYDEWHMPFHDTTRDQDVEPDLLPLVSAARCARVSYLTHNGVRSPDEDIRLGNDLIRNGHMTPLEMVAKPSRKHDLWWGAYRGWMSYRHELMDRSGRMVPTVTMREKP